MGKKREPRVTKRRVTMTSVGLDSDGVPIQLRA